MRTQYLRNSALVLSLCTVSSLALSTPHAISTGYMAALASNPLETKMVTAAALAVAGDAVAQGRDRKIYDISRAGSFVLFDACYRGGFQHAAFPWIIETCKGDMLGAVVKPELLDPGLLAALECTAFNQGLVVPVIYYPLFFSVTGALQGLSAWESLQRARSQFIPLTLRNWVFWVPAQVAQFALLPEELQVPYTCVMGLVWNIILSSQAGDARAEDEGARAQTAGCVKSKAYSQDGAKKKKTTTRMRVKKEEESNV